MRMCHVQLFTEHTWMLSVSLLQVVMAVENKTLMVGVGKCMYYKSVVSLSLSLSDPNVVSKPSTLFGHKDA